MNLDDLLKKSQGTTTPTGVKKTETKPVVQSDSSPKNPLESLLKSSQKDVVLYPQQPTFAEYNKAAQEAGKKDLSIWSKFASAFKTGVKTTLDYVGSKRKENEIESFKMRQMLYSRKDDPIRYEVGEDGKKKMTNNALEAFENAKTEEEKAAILAADTAEIPLIKMLNSPTGKKITKAISDKTSNVPLKAVAKFQSVGDEIYEAFTDPSFKNAYDVTTALNIGGGTKSNDEKYQKRLDPLITESTDESNPRWQKILYGVQNSGVQSAIGALLSVGTSYITRNPTAGRAVGTAYFGSISAEEERKKYEDGNIDNPSALGNIAIDTIGDQMISGLAESALKNFAKEGAEATLKEIFKQGAKGFAIEGGTEPTQSILKYANDYTAARTEEEKLAIVDSFSEYIKSGAMVDEFLIGGISGASINVIATGAGVMVQPVVDSKGVEVSPEGVETMKEQVKADVDAALDNGSLGDIVNLVGEKLDLPDESAEIIVQEVAKDIVADNTDRQAPEGSAEDVALQTDIKNLLEAGVNPADISIALSEQTAVSDDYAQNAVARALAELNAKVDQANAKLEEIDENTQKVQEDATKFIAEKLLEKGVEQDVIDQVSKPLAVAISGRGTPKQKLEAIALLSDPANADSRALYEEEMGVVLPATQEESEVVLKRTINKSKSRAAAEQMVMFELDRSEAGYRGVYGEHDATKENGGKTSFKVSSTFPSWIPSELRSKADFEKVQKAIEEGKRPKETDKIYKQAKLYDLIQGRIAQYEADLEVNAYIIEAPKEDADPNIAFQAANAQIQSESLISMEEAEAIVRKYFSADEVSLSFVQNLRTPRGVEAWGKYSRKVITFIQNPRGDTPDHEAVHAFLDLFVAEEDRAKFLKTAYDEQVERLGQEKVDKQIADLSKQYNDQLSDERVKAIYSEEALADGFSEYVKGRNQKSALQKFFEEVIAFLKSIADINDAQKLYEDIISRKRSRRAEYERSMREFKEETNGETFSTVKNRIHDEDRDILDAFIRHARKGDELSDADFTAAERLADKWGISMNRPLKTIANQFEKILDNKKQVSATILYSTKEEGETAEYLRAGQPPLGAQMIQKEDGEWVSTDEIVARERFDIPKLKKVSFGGSDRDVYAIGDDAVIKVVKTPRGIVQNDSSSDYYSEDQGLTPKTIERGKNYVVKERVLAPDANTKKMIAELKKLDTVALVGRVGGYDNSQKERTKAYEIMEKYGYSGWDLANYDVLWGDVTAIRNWGTTKEGKPIMLDEGTLNGDLVLSDIRRTNEQGRGNLSDPDFREIYNQSRAAKKKNADTDSKTMYSEKDPIAFVRSKTFSTQAFKNLAKKVPEFKKARAANSETHAYVMGKEKVKIESAKLQKIEGKADGMNTESYAVLISGKNGEEIAFISEKIEDSAKWIADNAGKSVSIEQNATATLFTDGNEAHVIVTFKDLIPLEIGNIQGTTDVQTIKFYSTRGELIETHAVTGDGSFAVVSLINEATRDNSVRITFPSYFAAIAGRPVLVKNDGVSRETGVDESKVSRVTTDQTSQTPVVPNLNDPKVKKSRAYEKAKERLAEQFQEDVTYTAVRIDDQMAKAFELVDNNFEYARAVALGLEQPPLDITDTAISIAVAERAKDTKDYQLQADAEKARSLRQSRRGQELVLERGRVDENSPEYFIRNLIDRRKFLAQQKYKPILSRLKPFTEILDERAKEAKKKGTKKLKTDLEVKGEELDAFLKDMAC